MNHTTTLHSALITAAICTAVLATAGLTGCQSQNEERLEASRSTWHRSLQQQADGTYSYVVPQSSWTGFAARTTLQYKQVQATYRRYESRASVEVGEPGPLELRWEERGAELGSHTEGAPLATLDALYERCATEVLSRDSSKNDIYLEFDDRNFLKTCVYVPKNCADDCSVGVEIADVTLGAKY